MHKEDLYGKIREYFKEKPVQKVEFIGSYARNEATTKSDIDIIITLGKPISLFKLSRYRIDLQELLGLEIDLTTKAGIDPMILPYLQNEIETV